MTQDCKDCKHINICSKDMYIIDNFVTDEWCDKFVESINDRIVTNKRKTFTVHSDALTDKYNDTETVDDLYTMLGKHIHSLDFVRANNFVLTSKYEAGGQIGIHTDTPYFRDCEKKEYSKYKVLVYLNDNFGGGNTEFYSDSLKKVHTIEPLKGRCVVFNMNIFHRGREVTDRFKYWMGFEIIGVDLD